MGVRQPTGAVTLFRDRGIPAEDVPWTEIPTGGAALMFPQCGAYTHFFAQGQVPTAGDVQPSGMPLPPSALIRVVGPTDQMPFGGKHFAASGARHYPAAHLVRRKKNPVDNGDRI